MCVHQVVVCVACVMCCVVVIILSLGVAYRRRPSVTASHLLPLCHLRAISWRSIASGCCVTSLQILRCSASSFFVRCCTHARKLLTKEMPPNVLWTTTGRHHDHNCHSLSSGQIRKVFFVSLVVCLMLLWMPSGVFLCVWEREWVRVFLRLFVIV